MSSSSSLSKRKKLTPDLVPSDDDDHVPSSVDAPSEKSSSNEDSETQAKKNKDNEYYFEMGKSRRVTVRKWKGKCYIDIREFYEDGGEFKPGKKGISLSVEQWESIKKLTGAIDKEVSRLDR